MILVDTSVWIGHLREQNDSLKSLLEDNQVFMHEFVIGELACGQLKFRDEMISLLQTLPSVSTISYVDVLYMVNKQKLYGSGIGWVDSNLLASALASKSQIWTFDKSLRKAAKKLNIGF